MINKTELTGLIRDCVAVSNGDFSAWQKELITEERRKAAIAENIDVTVNRILTLIENSEADGITPIKSLACLDGTILGE